LIKQNDFRLQFSIIVLAFLKWTMHFVTAPLGRELQCPAEVELIIGEY